MAAEAKQTKSEKTAKNAPKTSLLEEIVGEMKMKPSDEGYDVARAGLEAFLGQVVGKLEAGTRIDRKVVDALVAELDTRISKQVDQILHHPEFQARESAWRSLKLLVDQTDFRENIKINILQTTKQELADDFDDASEVVRSGLYKQVYTAEYGQFGGKPFGTMIANFEFGLGSADIALLRKCAAVAAMAHAPFLAGADPNVFGSEEKDFQRLPFLKDLEALFEGPRYTKWHGFRESEDSRYVGLAMPRVLVRAPMLAEEGKVRTFNYEEDVSHSHEHYLWGNAVFALATRLGDSFAKYRWCPNIIGPQSGGAVHDLPIHNYTAMGEIQSKIPTEILISERREYELAEQGLIALTMRKGTDNAAFFSANSLQKPKYFGKSPEGRAAETNYRLGTQLPYMFIICRLAHYIKVLQREKIGSWQTRDSIQQGLQRWLSQYISSDVRDANIRPLARAQLDVSEVPGDPGWYSIALKVTPHFKYMGANFTLSLVGKVDKAAS